MWKDKEKSVPQSQLLYAREGFWVASNKQMKKDDAVWKKILLDELKFQPWKKNDWVLVDVVCSQQVVGRIGMHEPKSRRAGQMIW